MIGDYYKNLCKGINKRVWNKTVDLNNTRWKIHLVLKLERKDLYYNCIEGVYFTLVPDYVWSNDNFGHHEFQRISDLEMSGQIVADTSLEAYQKAINYIFEEFKLTFKDKKPAYISALKHIELVSENKAQEIVKQNEQLIEKRKNWK